MTSPLGVSGSCAQGVYPSGWGSTLPWEGPWGLVLATVVTWLLSSSVSSAFLIVEGGWWWLGCCLVSCRLFWCPRNSVFLWKYLLCLFGNWCGFWRLPHWLWCSSMCPFSQSDKPQAVQHHHEPGSFLEFCIVLSLNLHFSGLFFLQTSFQVGFLTRERMCSPTNINVILWLWV